MIRLRVSEKDAHYGGGLVDGAFLLHLFGDVATELLIRQDGDEGLFAGYEDIRFLSPVQTGDFIEAEGRIVKTGRTSRKIEFTARRVIRACRDISDSAAEVLEPPEIVCTAIGTCVTPAEKQRLTDQSRTGS